ncbi:PREDICTED: kinetochore protein Nuf2 [Propithecus coquereli]|uniref:kinetochore protein Nuf2 n=1 Tax=Propithecus coquereli TaxID=379532 RepID=UPI00063F0E3A|nr:PREDICTED: kinetochore protein Nuf2 [Propithecus coquereli]
METLSFPRYNVAEIVVHIRNKILTGGDGKNLSKSDLYPNPKPEVLYMIYMRALQIVYGIRLEHFYMMPVNSEVMYPHLMEGFLPFSNLFTHLISAIFLFIPSKSSADKMQQLNVAHQEALMKLERLDSVPVEEQEEFKQLSDAIQELQQSLNQDFHQKTTVLQEGNSQKKSNISEKTKRLNELKLSVVSSKEVQESLKTKIVDSPEKLKNYKEKMKDTVQKLKNSRQEVMEKYEIYGDSVDCLPACQLEVQLYQKKIQDLSDNREKLTSILKESLNLEDQIESDESELKKLKTEENSFKRLMIVKKEKLATAQFKINKKHEDVKQYKRTLIEYEEILLNLKTALEKYHEGIEKAREDGCAKIDEKTAELKKKMFRVST